MPEVKVTIQRERVPLELLLRELMGDYAHAINLLSQQVMGTLGLEVAFPEPAERESSAPPSCESPFDPNGNGRALLRPIG